MSVLDKSVFTAAGRRTGQGGMAALFLLLSVASVQAQQTPATPNPAAPATQAQTTPPAPATPIPAIEDKIAPDIKAEALWDGRKIVPFKALDNPPMVASDKADFLDNDDYVLGIVVNGEARAYPTRFLWWHHVINDTAGKAEQGGSLPIAVTYCSVCNSGELYDARLDGKPVKLDFYGLYNGVVTLAERDTQTVMLQVNGRFVKGPLTGEQLKSKAVLDTTWGQWRQQHPDTLVMSPDTPYSKFYSPKGKPEERDYQHFPAPFFAPSLTYADSRLSAFDKILGVVLPEKHRRKENPDGLVRRAYPIKALRDANGVLNDTFERTPVVALLEPATVTANAFNRRLDGKTLTFTARPQADGSLAWFDEETNTRWNIEGKAEEGPLLGKSLMPLENHLSQWYGWVAYYPTTSIYGRTEPPQPVDPHKQPDAPATR